MVCGAGHTYVRRHRRTYLGPDGGVRVDAAVERLEVRGLVLEVHDPVLELHLLLQQGDPAACLWVGWYGYGLVEARCV